MESKAYSVVGIGNAVVDVISDCDDAFLTEMGMHKGAMQLIDEARAAQIYDRIGPATQHSGGSVANSMAGLAQLGAKVAFIGRVRDDQLGRIFRHDMKAIGVDFPTKAVGKGKPTASSYILVTPDGERTMNTYIGACAELEPGDVDGAVIGNAKILFIEGYLWDVERAKQAIRQAIHLCRDHGGRVALSLSDTFCVDRYRAEFRQLVAGPVDILFANEHEAMALYETATLDEALAQLEREVRVAFVTRHEHGSVILADRQRFTIPPVPVARVVDSTGAGDAYAAGALYGMVTGMGWEETGALASRCASDIIAQIGPRAREPLKRHLPASS